MNKSVLAESFWGAGWRRPAQQLRAETTADLQQVAEDPTGPRNLEMLEVSISFP